MTWSSTNPGELYVLRGGFVRHPGAPQTGRGWYGLEDGSRPRVPRARVKDSPPCARARVQGLREGLLGKAWRSGQAEVGGRAGGRSGQAVQLGRRVGRRAAGDEAGEVVRDLRVRRGRPWQPQKGGEQEGRGRAA